MPDYQFNTNLSPAAQGTSLRDLIATAGGIQQFQQAQQMNPLQLQKAQMEIEQLKQTNPLAVRKATAEAGTAELGLSAAQTSALYGLAGGVLNDPRIQKGDKKEVLNALKEAETRSATFGIPKQVVEGVFTPLYAQAEKEHGSIKQVLGNIIQSGIGATGQQALQTPQLTTGPGGSPATYQTGTGTLREATIGGQTGGQAGGNVGGNVGGGAPSGVTATQMSLQYPVRRAGDIRPYAPSEAEDQKQGEAYRNNIVSGASNQTTSLRNLDEVIKQAEVLKNSEWSEGAGILGAAGRGLSTFLGTEQGVRYKQLSKDLANAQIANMKAMGLSTDADKTLIAAANGDYTYPPKVLEEIAHRNLADMKNIELQAQGAQNFSKKYGDNNLKTFQQLWGQNAKDSRVFEAISINESNLSKQEKVKRIDELFKGLTPEQIDKLTQQKNNLLKLSRTGEL